ncbi:S8 family serine peptidase [Sodalinema gerasimenkoae]|uniref:S8 family serine peptidase n=1 Tax=Sodalinema gerasimenkoae TaxID=2862348 RepID=UPI001FE55E48|nr:S8 family serine peptidase [Sodalinema gerasimenkoae]
MFLANIASWLKQQFQAKPRPPENPEAFAQTFILEPIYTPSGLVDTGEDDGISLATPDSSFDDSFDDVDLLEGEDSDWDSADDGSDESITETEDSTSDETTEIEDSGDPVDWDSEEISDEEIGEEIDFLEDENLDKAQDELENESSTEADESDVENETIPEEASDELEESPEEENDSEEETSDELDESEFEEEETSSEADESEISEDEVDDPTNKLDDTEDNGDEETSDSLEDESDLEDSDEDADVEEEEPELVPVGFEFPAFNSGIFQVGNTGEVGVDFLFDGGAYQGEVAFFSLAGFDELEFDSIEDFIAEAAQRAASGSEQGHIVISVADEGARFTGSLFGEPDWNTGVYQGVKTFNMNPGDEFGVMLVPNGRVSEVLNNPSIGGAKRPLFSLATANPEDGFHLGQIADLTGDGNTFVFEDKAFEDSDYDYDDVIFQIRGAVGDALHVENVIDPDLDWRQDNMGKMLLAYSKPYITPVNNEQWDLAELVELAGDEIDISDDLPSDEGIPDIEEDLEDFDEVTAEETEADSFDETEDEMDVAETDERQLEEPVNQTGSQGTQDSSQSSTETFDPSPVNDETSSSQVDSSLGSQPSIGEEVEMETPGEVTVSEDVEEPVDMTEDSDEETMVSETELQETVVTEEDSDTPPAQPQPLVAPERFEFAKEDQPLVGIIDTGFAENNPDLDYDNITLGRDWVDGNDNPLLAEGEGNEHGTHILGIIAAQQDNDLGIDGINPDAPIWLGRGVGSGEWANSLVEFVDAAVESGQPNAVVNLSMDLTQIDAEGNVTTRYELTPMERAAIEYARQNNVMIVAAAGNDGGVMSALGQASQEFDNIMTVGAAEQFDPDTSVWKGADRTDYSSYGQGLDVMAYGGTTENPQLSLAGEGTSGMAGTSVATAKVTGAVSQVWAANPELSYRQVVEIIRNTATDLGSTGFNLETGAGLINMTAAVHLAKATKPSEHHTPPILNVESWSGEDVFIPGERAVDIHSASFQGLVTAPAGANLRSGPGTNHAVAGTADFGSSLTFDAWQKGEYINYPGIGADDRWYRLAEKNQWISAAITNGNPPKPNPAPAPIEAPVSTPQTSTAGVPGQSRQYVVKAGDTLWGIAQRLLGDGNRWREIMKNPTGGTFTEAEAHRLQIGQSVYLPITQEIGTGKPVTPQPQPTPVRNISLKPGSSNLNFSRGQRWVTSTGYKFVFQHDGNLVLYSPQGQALWATGTNNTGANVFAVQTDGNVVLYEGSKVLWATNTYGNPGSRFSIQNDGNLVVYSSSGRAIFNTGTHGGRQRTRIAASQWLRDRNLKRFPGLQFSTVVSQATGKALDAGGSKNSVYPHPTPNSQNTFHQWGFEKVGNYYIIINKATGKALDAGGSGNKLPYIHPNPAKHNPYHLWKLTRVGSGYMIVNKATGRALDSGGDSGNQIYMHPNPMSWNNFHLWKLKLPGSGGSSSAWQHPLPGHRVSSEYGPRGSGFHYGIDVAAPTGTPIKAAKPGRVVEVGYHPNGWGNFVRINHPDGFQTIYAHMSRVNVSVGQTVSGGSTIGQVGSTGWSTGPHLHFEVRVAPYRWKTDNRNPRNYIRF